MVVLVVILSDHDRIGDVDEDRAKISGSGLHIV